ncbi:AhpD family alkylhydroperoxidase [Mycobacterium sp. OAE908]
MVTLSAAAAKDLDPDLAELIKIRASQMNHCAFCLAMHSVDARGRGISEQKRTLLPARKEAQGVYTEREQAALALTEEMTDLTGPSSPTRYTPARPLHSPRGNWVRSSQWR